MWGKGLYLMLLIILPIAAISYENSRLHLSNSLAGNVGDRCNRNPGGLDDEGRR